MTFSRSKQIAAEPSAFCQMDVESGPLCRSNLLCFSIMRRFSSRLPRSSSAHRIPHIVSG